MNAAASRRILVTGAGGQVGTALGRVLENATFATRSDLDVTDRAEVATAVKGHDLVIHLAAATDVDLCEADPELASQVNGEGTRNICEAAARTEARVIYISTDYVFDGRKRTEYYEDDAAAPVNNYGRSKLVGEHHVLRSDRGLVVRTSWVVGSHDSFIGKIVRAARSRSSLAVVCDQYGRPTFADDLAVALKWLVGNKATGVLHVAGDGEPCTWADLADMALRTSGSPTRVERITTTEYESRTQKIIAPRPRNSSLSLDAARSVGLPLADWRQSLHRFLRQIA